MKTFIQKASYTLGKREGSLPFHCSANVSGIQTNIFVQSLSQTMSRAPGHAHTSKAIQTRTETDG